MNILFIGPNSPEISIGGVERSITNLIHFCQTKTHHNIHLMLPTQEMGYIKNDRNIDIYFDTSLFLSKEAKNQKDIHNKARIFSQKIEAIIKTKHIDIICAENFHVGLPAAFSLLLNMVADKYDIPLILRVHSFAKKPLQVELINQLMWDRISCVSKSVTGDCFQKGCDINTLSTDYLGVDTSEFNDKPAIRNLKKHLGLDPHSKIVLSAGRIIVGIRSIITEKGFVNLIRAFSKLAPRYPELRLLLAIGKPPDILNDEYNAALHMLKGYITLNHIEEQTIIKQFELHEMADVYKGSDIFVLASENETFGQVFVEAMACGLPVIGTKVGSIPEIISDSYNGFLVNPDDASGLAQRIEEILVNSALRINFIDAGKKVIRERFTADQQFLSFFSKLERIVSKNQEVHTYL